MLWIHCSLGCLSVAKEFWSQSHPPPVSRCVNSSFGCGCLISMAGISAVCIGVVYSGFSAEFQLSSVSFSYEP